MSRIAVLQGGRSLERGVSLRSAGRVEDALERLGHEVEGIDLGSDLVPRLERAAPDLAFIALHGRDGEDGTVQELLELVGLPYTGSGVLACMRCSDKVLAKHLMLDAGLPTPPFHAFDEAAFRELGAAAALPAIARRLSFPLVVKPSAQGSALGVRVAETPDDVPEALVAAFSYGPRVLLERHVAGRDLAVSVLEDDDGTPRALPVVEAVPETVIAGAVAQEPERGARPSYDFEARYEIGRTRFNCPAELPEATTARAQELALAVFALLGCRGFGRIDLMVDGASGELFVLEANAIPGLTETSLLPQAAEAAGIGFDALVQRIVARAGADR